MQVQSGSRPAAQPYCEADGSGKPHFTVDAMMRRPKRPHFLIPASANRPGLSCCSPVHYITLLQRSAFAIDYSPTWPFDNGPPNITKSTPPPCNGGHMGSRPRCTTPSRNMFLQFPSSDHHLRRLGLRSQWGKRTEERVPHISSRAVIAATSLAPTDNS